MNKSNSDILLQCHRWIREFVIHHKLCPFARIPYEGGQIEMIISDASDPATILDACWHLIQHVDKHTPDEISNAFLIIPAYRERSFADFHQITLMMEELLEDLNNKDYQLVTFHPGFHFEGIPPEYPQNHVNQSPHPMIHILRAEEVSRAIASYGDTDAITIRNTRLMENLYRAKPPT